MTRSDFHFCSIALKAVLRNTEGQGNNSTDQLVSYYHTPAGEAGDSHQVGGSRVMRSRQIPDLFWCKCQQALLVVQMRVVRARQELRMALRFFSESNGLRCH